MLERVDTYLWSVRPVTMAPELAMAILQEKRDDGHSPTTEKMVRVITLFSGLTMT